ncbi:MAG: MAPEG family protein [Pseudomonadales bacterium]
MLTTLTGGQILVPFFGMMLLTLVVWIYMYTKRLTWFIQNPEAGAEIRTPEQLNSIIPESINRPSNNLKNLFELPVLFYLLCLYLLLLQQVDEVHIFCAYGFLVMRALHSIVHCTINHVLIRFSLYLLASACLWTMVVRAALHVFGY